MKSSAILKGLQISPQKARLVADMVRGQPAGKALEILRFTQKKAALPIRKCLESAIANAENNEGADVDALVVEQIMIDTGTVLKRFAARAKGRGSRILKRTSHITITVAEI
ncbi:MAG: 50S ribosomal protein L22 [Acidithiobacillus sp.]|jgi:large subunit ribosomal protein L22|uniref:Large ribosomal subunit protein uL22 n=2 Tax=Acidithiobacillus sulfuriphilus TaxID=1867749 RepID=A0A3M8R660_9PROT|nr:50S ribosomal protein L22 [Acidithiobacillus sulfuriphilus]MCL5980435.1 50S ribosomal protein L22 [Gammaproteobacteria bacterium]RNF64037.1 50S ribosomal protein L22 [Acidithiobacillus sulfuriphilus]